MSENSVGIGTLTQKMVLVSAEELAIINGDWLHQVPASDFEQARQQVTGEPNQLLHAARATTRVDSRLV